MLIFTNNILAINENFNKDVFNDKNIMKVPQKLEDEKKPVHAMGIYHFIYQNISDEDKKNQVLRNIKRLRNKTDNKYGFGLNANEGVGIEIRPLTENRKADLGLKGYNVYKLFVTNMNDTPIELNVHMTKYTAIPISGTQINALSSIESECRQSHKINTNILWLFLIKNHQNPLYIKTLSHFYDIIYIRGEEKNDE